MRGGVRKRKVPGCLGCGTTSTISILNGEKTIQSQHQSRNVTRLILSIASLWREEPGSLFFNIAVYALLIMPAPGKTSPTIPTHS